MPPRVIVYINPASHRSQIVGDAMYAGLRAVGENVECRSSLSYRSGPRAEIAVFYGLSGALRRVFADYRAHRKAIYIDLGYWGRRKRSRWDGYHKLILNSRHPNAYLQARRHPNDRFAEFRIPIMPWRTSNASDPIIVAGMSAKAAAAEGYQPQQWERAAIAKIRRHTKRPIIYRPKPNWPGAKPLPGAAFDPHSDLKDVLRSAHAVVTRHSNVGIDAILAGVPVFCDDGAALLMGTSMEFIHLIEHPAKPLGREIWAADLAYCQASVEEMASGAAWLMLRNEGLV